MENTPKRFNIIAAIDINNGIGKCGKLPWPPIIADIHYFRQMTCVSVNSEYRNAVIMCRGTFESIGSKPLKGRVNIVVSKSAGCKNIEGILTTTSFDDALGLANRMKGLGDIWVIGGEGIYKEAILHRDCNKLYITHIQEEYECDRHFPEIDLKIWNRESQRIEEKGRLIFSIYIKRDR